ncbi:ricin-type beta-trefoil lectin domain protein [Kitasatospora sp. NPDC048239]|uniref:ricin-type beta-trefoil lectin domain protein n=1 Tax=Kitasatospora sp. NPDC048239 TaxID=3364046 RepID=UPI003714F313
MLLRSAKIISAFALAVGAVTAGSVSPASAAPVPGDGMSFMLQNVATGKCLTATSAGAGFADVVLQGCDRYNSSQWWGNNGEKLMEMNYRGVCLVNQNGQPGTAICSSNNPNWWYGSNPSTLWSTSGGYLTTGGYTAWLGPNQGNFSQWARVF